MRKQALTGWHWRLAAVSALVQSACLHGARCHTHTCFSEKVTGIVYSTPSLGARQRAAGTCLSSGAYGVYGFPVADQPKMCVHTHVGMGDHVSSHRESLNPSPRQTLSSWGLR
jgi:hypothetical protein